MSSLVNKILEGADIRTAIMEESDSFKLINPKANINVTNRKDTVKESILKYDYEYGYYNNLEKDRKYFTDKLKKIGAKNIKVKKVRTDTKGMNNYEITYEVDDENFVLPLNYL